MSPSTVVLITSKRMLPRAGGRDQNKSQYYYYLALYKYQLMEGGDVMVHTNV
jgi:hypothetical protein